jgi:phosphoadenosine phosphosulfate reductase
LSRSANTCWPIGRWSAKDVYGWLKVNDLPVHPAYACTSGGFLDRDWLRVGIIGGPKGVHMGRAAWEWEYYPEIMQRLHELGIVHDRGIAGA